jgi:hypothetical protein
MVCPKQSMCVDLLFLLLVNLVYTLDITLKRMGKHHVLRGMIKVHEPELHS